MCFWFGLEILRLVYKKNIFWNIEWFLSYLTFLPPKKVAPPLMRVEKKFLRNWAYRGIKRSRILRWFQKCAEVSSLAKGKNSFTEKLNLWGLGKFCKKSFLWEKIFGSFLTQKFYTFLNSAQNSASFENLRGQYRRNFFSTLIRDGAVFLEVKRSNKIETVRYFEKCFFIN